MRAGVDQGRPGFRPLLEPKTRGNPDSHCWVGSRWERVRHVRQKQSVRLFLHRSIVRNSQRLGPVQMPVGRKMGKSIWRTNAEEYYTVIKRGKCNYKQWKGGPHEREKPHTKSKLTVWSLYAQFREGKSHVHVQYPMRVVSGDEGTSAREGAQGGRQCVISGLGCDRMGVFTLWKLPELYVYDLFFCVYVTLQLKTKMSSVRSKDPVT